MTEVQPTWGPDMKETTRVVKYIHVIEYGGKFLVSSDGLGQLPCTNTRVNVSGLQRERRCEFYTHTEKYVVIRYRLTRSDSTAIATHAFGKYGNYHFAQTDNPQTKRIVDLVSIIKDYAACASQSNKYHSGNAIAPQCPQNLKGEIIQILPEKLVILVRWLGGDVKILPINTVKDIVIGQSIIVDKTRYQII